MRMLLNMDWLYKGEKWWWCAERWVGTSRWKMWCWDGRIVGGFSVGKTTWRSWSGGGGRIDWLLTDVRLSMLSIKLKCDIEKLILCGMNGLLPVVWWNDCMYTLESSIERSLIPSRLCSATNPELLFCPVTEVWSCHRAIPGELLLLVSYASCLGDITRMKKCWPNIGGI